ncbi:MAG: hypothetical protein H0U76_03880 [Ktedonobacteraceae bacterium]|nr:hypothetical protein [Ktedonobacteraceae bacterium]
MSKMTTTLLVCFIVLVVALAFSFGGVQTALVFAVIICGIALLSRVPL